MPKRKRRTQAAFQHRRLTSPRSIRIVSLHPSSELSAPLEVSLFEASIDGFLSEEHSYEALSYVWGARTGNTPCECDGKQLLITPNCDDALRHLRLPYQARNLWVDAICIDQGSSEESSKERNIQITLMGEVYCNAERTFCWVGKGEAYTAGTFGLLRRIGDCPSKRELRKLLAFDQQLRQKGVLEPESTCLNHIFCHPWHSRVWTLQEVAFSKDCQVLCGTEAISWDLYFKAAKSLIEEDFIDELDAQAWKNYLGILIRDETRKYLIFTSSEEGVDRRTSLLISDLTQVRHLQATNPKDKIYGLYAVFTALGISFPAPDYGKTLENIFEEACVAMIRHSGTLQMLEYASSNARAPDLPSWVADWQDKEVTLANPPTHATEGSRISQENLSTLSPTSGQLQVRGVMVGLITTRAKNDFATLDFPSGSFPILNQETYQLVNGEVDMLRMLVHRMQLFREWMYLVDALPPIYSGEDSAHFFHQILTFKSDSSDARLFNAWVNIIQYPNTEYDLSSSKSLADAWKSADNVIGCGWNTELYHCSVIAATLLASATGHDRFPPEVAELLEFTQRLMANMSNRALIQVHDPVLKATLPGTAFHTAKMNDSVFLLEGADYAVVLRPRGDQWSFVGPAYIVGIMDGEAWLEEKIQELVLV